MISLIFCLAVPLAVPVAPNYAEHVAPILIKHCVVCHRPEEVAPFSLLTYEDARKRANFIVQITQEGRMPPWKPEPDYNQFHDARVLSDDEKGVLAKWAKIGTPSGDLAKAPKPPAFESNWQLGKPDLILEMPAEFTVPAGGNDVYRCFVLPTGLKEDRTVAAIEFEPGNARVVHHALVFLDQRGLARKLDAKDAEPGFATFGGPGFLPTGGLGGWAPGSTPRRLPEGLGRMLGKGSDVVVQMHYHPSGKVEKDKSKLGIYFTPKPAENIVGLLPMLSREIRIPAGEKRYNRHVEFTVPETVRVVAMTPHMHLLGKEMKVRAITPEGREIPLVWVKDWNFNWQDTYMCKEQVEVPAGSKFVMDAWYDNSADNPLNPSTPPKEAVWGEQTTNEMCLCFISIIGKNPKSIAEVRMAALRQMVTPAMLLRILSGN